MDISVIGTRIRQCRRERDMTQAELAEATNLTPNYIGVLERGEKVPSLETFITLANALDVSLDSLAASESVSCDHSVDNAITHLSEKEKTLISEVVKTILRNL